MARNPIQDSNPLAETDRARVEVGGRMISGPDSLPITAVPTSAGVVVGGPFKSNPEKDAMVPKIKQYVVQRAGTFLRDGLRYALPEGKIVDDVNYDIDALKLIGIKLAEMTE